MVRSAQLLAGTARLGCIYAVIVGDFGRITAVDRIIVVIVATIAITILKRRVIDTHRGVREDKSEEIEDGKDGKDVGDRAK